MQILFRADANTEMGTGHLHRCLTLADALIAQFNAQITFVTNILPSGVKTLIENKGFELLELRPSDNPTDHGLMHGHWLSTDFESDIEQIQSYLSAQSIEKIDWFVCDHYGLDAKYHNLAYSFADRLMVIDDLADRMLNCDLVMDQTFNRPNSEYKALLLNEQCETLLGTHFALLRPEFAEARAKLTARSLSQQPKVMMFLGGGDPFDLSGSLLHALTTSECFEQLQLTLVVGLVNPHLEKLNSLASQFENVEVLVDCKDMATLMLQSDIAIGASGATSWERCCLGLPSILVTLADNQKLIAQMLQQAGAILDGGNAIIKDEFDPYATIKELDYLIQHPQKYQSMVDACLAICDGNGVYRVTEKMAKMSSIEVELRIQT